MSSDYGQLLDATIHHLQDLKSRGTRYVEVSTETLRSLSQPPVRVAQVSKPAVSPISKSADRPIEKTAEIQPTSLPLASQPETSSPRPVVAKSSVEKSAAFAALRDRVMVCVKCAHLASSRKNVVFGVGNIDAQLMFVGEAPGADEDAQGEPFVGRAGELLTKIIQAMGLQRGDVFIANILKCRPDTPGQSSGNRKPTPDEMATCVPYLHEQIDIIQPRVLVALGATAIEGLLGKTMGIMKMRGNWQTYRGTPLMPTFHPAYLLRNQAMSEKRKVWEDMLSVMGKLEMPVSEKQQNYFTKG